MKVAPVLLTSMLVAMLGPATSARIPVVLDTDIGTDFDDTWALIYILSRSDIFDLRLIQCSTFNTTERAQVTAKILHDLNRFDVPIAVGINNGQSQLLPQYAYAQNYTLSQFVSDGGTLYSGVSQFAGILGAASPSNPVFVVEIAPATSLGAVLALNPGLAGNAVTVAMSGSVFIGYFNSTTIDAEYNVKVDVQASQRMYNATWAAPLVTAPLDTTVFMQFFGATYQTLLNANGPSHSHAQVLLQNYEAWYQGGGSAFAGMKPFSPSTGTDTLYDVQAAWMTGFYAQALGYLPPGSLAVPPQFPNIFTLQLPLVVNNTGYTVPDPVYGQPVFPATRFLEGAYKATDAIGADIIASIIAAK